MKHTRLEIMIKRLLPFILMWGIAPVYAGVVAELKQVQGSVLVNHGKGFVPYADHMLFSGDGVLVMAGATALVKFSEDCVVKLTANSLLTLSKGISCKNVASYVQSIGPYYAAAIGIEAVKPAASDATAAEGADDGQLPESGTTDTGDIPVTTSVASSGPELTSTQWVLIGAGIGAGVGLAISSGGSNGNNNKSISPQ